MKKWKKLLETSSFYTCVLKTTSIWGKVPEIQIETEKFFFFLSWANFNHFTLAVPHPPSLSNNPENQNFEKNKNHNHMMYASWDTECKRHNFLSFWVIFCIFTQLLTPKIKIWKKCTKSLEMLSFYTHMCTINEDHIMYGSTTPSPLSCQALLKSANCSSPPF